MTTIEFPGLTRHDLPPERILDRAMDRNLDTVVVLGFTADGEFYFASSAADGGNVAWLLTRALHKLHMQADESVSAADVDGTAQVLPMARPVIGRAEMCAHGYVRSTCSQCRANTEANLYPV